MSEAREPSIAKAPFDNLEGDVILQSADGINFYVFKLILSLASEVFKSMFALPQDTEQSDVSSVPVIPLAENSTTLRPLLLICYPASNPTFEIFEDAKAVLEAARKYDIRDAVSSVRDIVFSQFLETKPLELYALSCVFGWKKHAQIAATQTLQINLKDPGRPGNVFTGMKDITAFDYHTLLVFHHDCGIAAQAAGQSLQWLSPEHATMCIWKCASYWQGRSRSSTSEGCSGFGEIRSPWSKSKVSIAPWFDEYLVSTGKELLTRPCESTIWRRDSYNRAIDKAITCSFCRSTAVESLERFRVLYAAEVQRVLEQIVLKDV